MRIEGKILAGAMALGALTGTVTGLAMANHAIDQVPLQQETVELSIPITQRTLIGEISEDFRTSGTIRPNSDPEPSEGVYRDQPVMGDGRVYGQSASSQVRYDVRQEVRQGHGSPSTQMEQRSVEGYRFEGQDRSVRELTESRQVDTKIEMRSEVVDHREESYTIPGRCVSVHAESGSSSQECEPDTTGTREVPVYGDRPHKVPVYQDFVVGHSVSYTPRVSSQVLDTYDYPVTTFDHGVNVGGYLMTGGGIGLGLGGALGAAGSVLLASRKRGGDDDSDPSLHSESMDADWRVSTAQGTTHSDAELDQVLGPFSWHAHKNSETGEKYWDYHRVPAETWHQHRASVSRELVVADRSHQDLVGDNWIAFKFGEEPEGYNDPQFDTYRAKDPQSGELIFIDMLSKDGIMERKGGPHESHPNISSIQEHQATITRNHRLGDQSHV